MNPRQPFVYMGLREVKSKTKIVIEAVENRRYPSIDMGLRKYENYNKR